jgi:hypothetical protein
MSGKTLAHCRIMAGLGGNGTGGVCEPKDSRREPQITVKLLPLPGEREKSLDLLGPRLTMPCCLPTGQPGIDSNFARLNGHPRFVRLLRVTESTRLEE